MTDMLVASYVSWTFHALLNGMIGFFVLWLQVEVDYQGGGSYKRKYRVREVVAKGPMDLFFTNTQVCKSYRGTTSQLLISISASLQT